MKPIASPDSEPPPGASATRWPGAALAVLAIAVAVAATAALPFVRVADLALVDAQFGFLARHWPLAARDAIVVVGIDEATLAAETAPIALSHRMLARAFAALARAAPRAVGVDVILPERSYETLAPGGDAALIGGLL
ncbi:MAG TPA: CHASE2 domain-containing protein, partial [Casimicrobiaceae bacterium]|nr:CHASE2 domain-containing protein [Casimicrobiaceae bacterium]